MDKFERNPGIDAGPPYAVWKSPAMPWWCVVDKAGTNVMRASDHSGRVFTDEPMANRLCEEWNGSARDH